MTSDDIDACQVHPYFQNKFSVSPADRGAADKCSNTGHEHDGRHVRVLQAEVRAAAEQHIPGRRKELMTPKCAFTTLPARSRTT